MKLRYLIAIAALAGGVLFAASTATGDSNGLGAVRAATAKFHDFGAVSADGRGEFRDAMGIACIAAQGLGAMGIHYVKGSIVGDGAIDASDPEAVIYEPQPNGRKRLVALEYVVFKADWDANHASPPALFGQTFNFTPSPNRYGLPPIYSLHARLWKANPAGMFAPWNPNVSCAAA